MIPLSLRSADYLIYSGGSGHSYLAAIFNSAQSLTISPGEDLRRFGIVAVERVAPDLPPRVREEPYGSSQIEYFVSEHFNHISDGTRRQIKGQGT